MQAQMLLADGEICFTTTIEIHKKLADCIWGCQNEVDDEKKTTGAVVVQENQTVNFSITF